MVVLKLGHSCLVWDSSLVIFAQGIAICLAKTLSTTLQYEAFSCSILSPPPPFTCQTYTVVYTLPTLDLALLCKGLHESSYISNPYGASASWRTRTNINEHLDMGRVKMMK